MENTLLMVAKAFSFLVREANQIPSGIYVLLGGSLSIFGSVVTTWYTQRQTSNREVATRRHAKRSKAIEFRIQAVTQLQDAAGELFHMSAEQFHHDKVLEPKEYARLAARTIIKRYDIEKLAVRCSDVELTRIIVDYSQNIHDLVMSEPTLEAARSSGKKASDNLNDILRRTGSLLKELQDEQEDMN